MIMCECDVLLLFLIVRVHVLTQLFCQSNPPVVKMQ